MLRLIGDRRTLPLATLKRVFCYMAAADKTQYALIAPRVINGAMIGAAFDTYIETQLAPVIDPGTVVILDNLSTHRSPRTAEAQRQRGCWLRSRSLGEPCMRSVVQIYHL